MRNLQLDLSTSECWPHAIAGQKTGSGLGSIILLSVIYLPWVLIATNVSALTVTEEQQLIKRCDKINAKIKNTKLASRAGGTAARMEKLRLKVYALDDEYSEHKCILVRSKLKML